MECEFDFCMIMRALVFSVKLRITMDHRGDSRCPVGDSAKRQNSLWMLFERTAENGGGIQGQ